MPDDLEVIKRDREGKFTDLTVNALESVPEKILAIRYQSNISNIHKTLNMSTSECSDARGLGNTVPNAPPGLSVRTGGKWDSI